MMFAKILIIDSDRAMADVIAAMLTSKHTPRLWQATTAADARPLWAGYLPDLVVIDPALPDEDGLAFCQRMRKSSNPWIIATSASGDRDDEVAYLDVADMFLRKPFFPSQLLARLAALARRSKPARQGERPGEIVAGPLRMNPMTWTAFLGEKPLHLTPTEFKLLAVLMAHTSQICTRQLLAELVWGLASEGKRSFLKTHIRHLRVKIGEDLIETIPQVGYRFVASGAQNGEKQDRMAVVQ